MCLVEASFICNKFTITVAVLKENFFKMICITAVILSGKILNLTSKQKVIINNTSKTNYGYVMMQQSILLLAASLLNGPMDKKSPIFLSSRSCLKIFV